MAAHVDDLLGAPDFPVYGLDPRFDGHRWLVGWNDRDVLYSVSLGHGDSQGDGVDHPSCRAEWLTVSTELKTPLQEIDDGVPVAKGPTGYEDAMLSALIGIGERVFPDRDDAARWVAEQVDHAHWGSADPRSAPSSHGRGWVPGSVAVDGEWHASFSRRLNGWWTTLVDLPTVAVSMTGPDSMAAFGTSVVDVRGRLTDYR